MRFISLFSGIEAASVAWLPLGWTCAAVAEIDKFPCAVLKHHYPDVLNLGNVCGITRDRLIEIGAVDAIVFGFPCQDLSVAGKRAGLKGARSGLFFEAMRIVEICRELWGTRWTIAENVPGLFSSNGGLDFAAVVGEMAGAEFAVPKSKWQNTGVALGPRGLVSWAVLDAQWFGVPQRRRRVFLVRDSGDWRSGPPVLSFPESLQGNSPPSREKRESAPTIPSRRTAGGGLGTNFDCDGGLVTGRPVELAHSLRADGFDASKDGTGRGTPPVPVATLFSIMPQNSGKDYKARTVEVTQPIMTSQVGGNQGGDYLLVPAPIAFSCKDSGADSGEVAPTLRSMNFSGSHANAGGQIAIAIQERAICENPLADPDGVGVRTDGLAYTVEARQVTQAVAFVQNTRDEVRLMGGDGQSIGALAAEPGMKQQCYVAFNLRGREGGSQPEPCDQASLRSASGGSSRSYVATAFEPRYYTRDNKTGGMPSEVSVLKADAYKMGDSAPHVAVGWSEELTAHEDCAGTVQRGGDGGRHEGVMTPAMQVRRLTPTECERLQKFPDGYTKISEKTADGPRYKALGNSMAVCCMEWIGRRIQLVDLFS